MRIRRSVILNLVFGVALLGLALARLNIALSWVVLGGLGVVIMTMMRRRAILVVCLILCLGAGWWRGHQSMVDQARLTGLIGQSVALTGNISDDPSIDSRGFMSFTLNNLKVDGRPMAGSLSVYTYAQNLHRGYVVQAAGKVKPGFGNVVAELSYPKLSVTSTRQDWLERLRQNFFVGVRTALPEPMASFALGLLVGVRALIPKAMQQELALIGLSHLVAVSGYNLTIMVSAADRLLQRLGRGVALIASLWLIGGFLIVTGASASIVRASLVAVMALLAAFYGRRFQPVTLILLAACGTALYKPSYLSDIGWLLSFAAFYGIMVLAPVVEARLDHPRGILAKLFIESTSAQVMTIPLILYFFGQLSIVAPFTNLVILPMVPLAMLLGFVAGLAGMIIPAFAGWLAWPAVLLLKLMLAIIDQFASLSWAGTTFRIDLATMLAMYGLCLLAVWGLKRANHRRGTVEKVADPMMQPGLTPTITST